MALAQRVGARATRSIMHAQSLDASARWTQSGDKTSEILYNIRSVAQQIVFPHAFWAMLKGAKYRP
jgi:hypothetical protein